MNYEEAAIKILATEDNLLTALEITDIMTKWRERTHKVFWRDLNQNLSRKLAEANELGRWEVVYNFGKLSNFKRDYFSCAIKFVKRNMGQQYFNLEFQQGPADKGYPLTYGITRRRPEYKTQEKGVEEVVELARSLQADGFEDDGSWYIGRKFLDFGLMDPEVLLRFATDKDGFLKEMAGLEWNLFYKHIEQISTAHEALAAR